MIRFTKGNLLEADVEAIVNTVNTVGVMGKGIALMVKERFPDNFKAYEAACKRGEVQIGHMFVTGSERLDGPRWIINFPTKKHWRHRSKIEWVSEGLKDLRALIRDKQIHSIAIPPLGSGNGGLDWAAVRPLIVASLEDLPNIDVLIFEPTARYHNVAKGRGVEKLTPARALIAEMIRRYALLGLDCSILEVQKLAWVLTRVLHRINLGDPLKLNFTADRYGPFAPELTHLLNALDGSFLHCEKRLADASPMDLIQFDVDKQSQLTTFFSSSEGAVFVEAIEQTDKIIDGFQSPLGMEILATVDWLLTREHAGPTVKEVRSAIEKWPAGTTAALRKQRLFTDKLLQSSLGRLNQYFGPYE